MASMSAKDYWRIADALHEAREPYALATLDPQVRAIDAAALTIADALKRDNPRFDRDRFMSAVIGAGVLR